MDKKYLLRIVGYIALALAAVILIVDIAYQLTGSMVNSVETLPVSLVQEDLSITADCYIVRDEVPVEHTSDGLLTHTVADGTRVSAGDKVAEVYGGDAGQSEQLEQLYHVTKRRQLLEEAFDKKGSYSSGAVDREITRLKSEIDAMMAEGKTTGLSALTDSLQVMLYIRELKVGNDLSSVREALEQEILQLQEAVGGALSSVESDRAGYYFSSCDGYESFLRLDDLATASADDLRALLNRETAPLETDATAGKIVTDYTWCAVTEIPVVSARQLSQGSTYSVSFSEDGNAQVQMHLDRMILDYGSESAIVIFSCEEMPQDFSYTRYQSVSIVWGVTGGYRIPVSALRNRNGITGVYVLRGSVVEFREVAPVVLSDGAVLVDSAATPTGEYPMLNYYDTVIVRGKELYVGKIVEQ
ncbi:MAG: hypothetical protein IJX47_06970 [Clostridia bacterium]|nr:hypothetical protein [Clostridia bacterium]MBQ8382925.1 hypothetical protein [Clostridia bacterium]